MPRHPVHGYGVVEVLRKLYSWSAFIIGITRRCGGLHSGGSLLHNRPHRCLRLLAIGYREKARLQLVVGRTTPGSSSGLWVVLGLQIWQGGTPTLEMGLGILPFHTEHATLCKGMVGHIVSRNVKYRKIETIDVVL